MVTVALPIFPRLSVTLAVMVYVPGRVGVNDTVLGVIPGVKIIGDAAGSTPDHTIFPVKPGAYAGVPVKEIGVPTIPVAGGRPVAASVITTVGATTAADITL